MRVGLFEDRQLFFKYLNPYKQWHGAILSMKSKEVHLPKDISCPLLTCSLCVSYNLEIISDTNDFGAIWLRLIPLWLVQ